MGCASCKFDPCMVLCEPCLKLCKATCEPHCAKCKAGCERCSDMMTKRMLKYASPQMR